MKLGVFAIKDKLVGFTNLWLDQSTNVAKRGFMHSMQYAAESDVRFSNPSDYSLYRLGHFETESGLITLLSVPEFICEGVRRDE